MIPVKKEFFSGTDHFDFFGSDEYDMVSSDDILLMSEKELYSEENDSSEKIVFNYLFSSTKQYEEEWDELYNNEEIDLDKLKKKCIEGQLKTIKFRSIFWRCLLGILHVQPKQWLCQLQTYRKHYDEICIELEQNPWNIKGINPYDNPLSQESDSIWQKYFCDEELKAVIYQDVKRTFPGMEYFRRKDVQEMMVRILFCYARQNPALCYRQGMHEILAPIIFVLHCDQLAFFHIKEEFPKLDKNICDILSPNCLEQDAYSIFKCIMNHIECSYRLNDSVTTESLKCESKTCQSEVIWRLDFIKKKLLHPKDPELSEYLQKLDIPLHLFGLRWLRLLFGREFPLHDLLVLWDFIFSNNFESVDFIVVAMLIAIRQILLNGDYTDCLSNLMRYPGKVDVAFVIRYALHLSDPQKYSCPDTAASFYNVEKNKSACGIMNSQSPLNRRLKKCSSVKPSAHPFVSNETSDGSVSGSAANDLNHIKSELEQTKTLLNVVCYKLIQFHSSLTINLQSHNNADIQGVLDGIYELSCLLKSYSKGSNGKDCNGEIETACEAGETREPNISNSHFKTLNPVQVSINSEKKSHTLPKIKRGLKSGELKVFKHQVGGTIEGVPMIDPLHLIKTYTQDEGLESCSKYK